MEFVGQRSVYSVIEIPSATPMGDKAMRDAVVEEVRRIREEHAANFNYDVDAIYADLKRLEAESELRHVSLEPRRLSQRALLGKNLASWAVPDESARKACSEDAEQSSRLADRRLESFGRLL